MQVLTRKLYKRFPLKWVLFPLISIVTSDTRSLPSRLHWKPWGCGYGAAHLKFLSSVLCAALLELAFITGTENASCWISFQQEYWMKAIRAFPKSRAFKESGESVFLHKEPEGTLEREGWGEGRKGEYQRQALSCPSMWWVCPQHMNIIKWATCEALNTVLALMKQWACASTPGLLLWKEAESALPSWYINERSLLGLAASVVLGGCSGGEGLAAGRGKQDKLSPPCLFRRFSLKLFSTSRQIDLSKAQIWAYCSPT